MLPATTPSKSRTGAERKTQWTVQDDQTNLPATGVHAEKCRIHGEAPHRVAAQALRSAHRQGQGKQAGGVWHESTHEPDRRHQHHRTRQFR